MDIVILILIDIQACDNRHDWSTLTFLKVRVIWSFKLEITSISRVDQFEMQGKQADKSIWDLVVTVEYDDEFCDRGSDEDIIPFENDSSSES